MDEELAFHFDSAVADLERRGLAPDAAHAEAARRFGDVRRYRGELRAIAHGRAADVRAVGEHVRAVVRERFGIRLEYEIEFVGDWEAA